LETSITPTPDWFEIAYDWFCKKNNNQKIAGSVERPSEEPKQAPDWCPLRKIAGVAAK
jgi:hypothetical protein